MKPTFLLFVVLLALLQTTSQQIAVQYVPAHFLVPVYNISQNASHISSQNNASRVNSTSHEHTQRYGWQAPPPTYGWNYSYAVNMTTPEGNLIVGNIGPLDRLLFSREYYKPSRWWSGREKVVEYPKDIPAGYLRHETIHAVRVYNRLYNGNQARAEIQRGGIGYQFLRLKLSSNWGQGFRFQVQIYGQ